MTVLIPQEGVYLNRAVVVGFLDIILVPLELGKMLYGSSDIAKTLSSRLRALIHSLHRLHSQLGYYSAK